MDAGRHVDKIAIVTGAGSGIGAATALRLLREGASVVAGDIASAGLEALRGDAAETAGRLVSVVGDITAQADVDALVAAATNTFGRVDIVANVAGIMDWFLPAHEVDDATWRRVMAVNLDGPMMLTRAVLPGMRERGSGVIVNVASVGGLRGGAAGAAYTASKHALVGLTRNVAWTYAEDGIRCDVVCPGGVQTNIGSTATPRSDWGMGRLGRIHGSALRMASPDEVATLISWLASDEASNVNGAVVTDDGGWMAG
jgi:NAD(P)-dependent dehydrogenase (short-subunit alcohol dehydrogenase family)